MVNIPEQAVRAGLEAFLDTARTVDGIKAALTAAAPHMSGVKVKQLRWREKDSGAYAHCSVGYYEIKETRLGFCVYHNKFLVSKDMFETLESAKVAAQDNLERRLLVCLSGKPVDVAAVREQALEEAAKKAEELLVYADTTSRADKVIPAAIRAIKSQPAPQTGGRDE